MFCTGGGGREDQLGRHTFRVSRKLHKTVGGDPGWYRLIRCWYTLVDGCSASLRLGYGVCRGVNSYGLCGGINRLGGFGRAGLTCPLLEHFLHGGAGLFGTRPG
jgi:hypothetical protein